MNDIQRQITEAAERYDAALEADGQASRALLQGTFMGIVMKEAKGGTLGACRIQDLDQDVDEHGNYLPYFTIITGAGHRVRVTFELE